MASVQEHYDQHLGPIYSWMVGGIEAALERGAQELDAVGVTGPDGGQAVDLGAGFGMHAVPLAQRGFAVLALDACAVLLDELRGRAGALPVRTVQDDFQRFRQHLIGRADLVLCMGDTLTHLPDRSAVEELIGEVSESLRAGGRFLITLRDYSSPPTGERRFIPVRGDEKRILTCFLEYTDSHVTVHDLLHAREGSGWSLRVSRYNKLRIAPDWLDSSLQNRGFAVRREAGPFGMIRFVAQRV